MIDDRPVPGAPTIAAFTSSTNGIGRTAVVANLAWVLAASGHRVAVADWGSEAPHVHDFLQPFHARTLEVADLLAEVLEISPFSDPARRLLFDEETFPALEARRYELPGGLGRVDLLASRDPSTPVRGFSSTPRGPGEVETLREGIRRSSYDYVLIDSPTNLSPDAAARMARLCDVVAVCFEPMRSSISQAAGFAHDVWDSAPVGVRVLAVPVQFDRSDPGRAEQALAAITATFARLLTPDDDPFGRAMSAELVPIPLYRKESFVETLAVLVDDSGVQLDAYRELAIAVAGAGIGTVRELAEDLRESYRRSIGLSPTHIALEYVPKDRPWADWVRSQLRCAGAEVTCDRRPGDALVRIVSRNSPAQPEEDRVAGRVVVITVDDSAPPEGCEHVSLAKADEATARTAVLEAFSLVAGGPGEVRYPAGNNVKQERRRRSLPRRLGSFSGRGAELEEMRDALSDVSALRTWWVAGPAGVGKTELAKEYAHRFGFDYVYVWWIPAHDRRTITERLAGLAHVLGIEMENHVTEAVLDRLCGSPQGRRWLLVYDGADDPEVLRGLVPTRGCGHVVITSRVRPDGRPGAEIGPLAPQDSVAFLRAALPDLPGKQLVGLADLAEHEPLTLRLARSWILQTAKQRRREAASREDAVVSATEQFCALFSAQDNGSGAEKAVGVLAGTFTETGLGRAVLRLVKMCTFLSSAGVSVSLLHSAPMLAVVAQAEGVAALDDLELDAVLWHGVRYGLFEVAWGKPATLTVHRLVLSLADGLMDDDERAAVQCSVLAGLAALAPSESQINDGSRMADIRELREHVLPSGAMKSECPAVRRWLVNQMRYFLVEGDPEAWRFAAGLSERLLESWPEDVEVRLRLCLRFHLGNFYKALDRPTDALNTDERLLKDQRRLLGRDDPHTLRTARGVAHGNRVLGNFAQARTEEARTERQMRAVLGEDHRDTLRATNNLAFSLFLAGETGEALKVQRENFERKLAVLGPDDLDVWWSACSVGRYLRELGQYVEALDELREAAQRVAVIGPSSPRHELRIKWNRAITYRLLGEHADAKSLTQETLRGYRHVFGPDHADTRACKLSFAADHHAIGDFETATRLARECYDAYHERQGAYHAFTLMCLLDQAIFLHSLGRSQEEALRAAKEARDGLVTRLGDVHPWSLAARLGHAVIDGRTADVDRGSTALREVRDECVEWLGATHPVTVRAEANLKVSAAEWKCVVLDVPDM